jgi:RNA polymerase sigma-70 factor, ECF subfamily
VQHQVIAALHRRDGARLLAGLIRRFHDFEAAEDALQEAYSRALRLWPSQGIPKQPAAWVNAVAQRCLIDRLRKTGKEVGMDPDSLQVAAESAEFSSIDVTEDEAHRNQFGDDLLCLIFMCCHPSLAPSAQMALSLRCLCRLSTQEIARAFVEPEAATAQKLVRARRKIREAGIPFSIPGPSELPDRLATVLAVVYLLFNEGFTATRHSRLGRPDLIQESLHLADLLATLMPEEPEVLGLQALLLLHSARMPAREDAEGTLIPLDEQDRSLWLEANIRNGKAILDHAIRMRRRGPYQVQAAIAALHASAPKPEMTDWVQIHALYRALLSFMDTPVIRLNCAVAQGMAGDYVGATQEMETLAQDGKLAHYHLLPAARAELARRQGHKAIAIPLYEEALALVENLGERQYLERRFAEVLRN